MASPKPKIEVEPFIQAMPKIEMHIHIEGTLTPKLRWHLAQKNNIELPFRTFEELEASYTAMYNHRPETDGQTHLHTFLEVYYEGMKVLRNESDFYDLATACFDKLASMNVKYVEPFFDIQAHTRRGVPVAAVMDGLKRATEDAKTKSGLLCNWTLCFLRDMSVESAQEAYDACAAYRGTGFQAIGLDSNEFERPPMLFDALYRQARADGLRVTSHCDVNQKDTHEHIKQVASQITGKGLDRIDHGLNAAEMPELIRLIKERDLGMTLCPHAYHRRRSTDYVFSRLKTLLDAGIKVTINSDDPTYFHDMWVAENLQLVRTHCHLSDGEMLRLQRNAVEICWATEEVKKGLSQALDEFAKLYSISQ